MDKIILYSDEFDTEVWEKYCDICGVPSSATIITIYFDHKKVNYE